MSEEQLQYLLTNLVENVDGLLSTALISTEGLIVQSILEEEVSELKIAAMSATILSTCERVLLELKQGELDICVIQGNEGYFIIMSAGESLILVTVLAMDARLDICFIEMRKIANQIKSLS